MSTNTLDTLKKDPIFASGILSKQQNKKLKHSFYMRSNLKTKSTSLQQKL